MFSNLTFGKRLAAGFALAGLTLLVISVISYRNTHNLIDNDNWVSHSYEVRPRLPTYCPNSRMPRPAAAATSSLAMTAISNPTMRRSLRSKARSKAFAALPQTIPIISGGYRPFRH